MKYGAFISTLLFSAAVAFADGIAARPLSSVPTPAERMELSKDSPKLGAKESADWQRMREERKHAREQILSNLRKSSIAEKQNIQQNVSQKRNSSSRFEGASQNNPLRERKPSYERPDSHNMNPMRTTPVVTPGFGPMAFPMVQRPMLP